MKKNVSNNIDANELSFVENGVLVVHLRMTGYFTFNNTLTDPCKHTRIRLFDKNNNELRYIDVRSFGQMWWVRDGLLPNKIIKGLGSLGPEPFSEKGSGPNVPNPLIILLEDNPSLIHHI